MDTGLWKSLGHLLWISIDLHKDSISMPQLVHITYLNTMKYQCCYSNMGCLNIKIIGVHYFDSFLFDIANTVNRSDVIATFTRDS